MDSHLIVWKAFSLGKVKLFPSFTRYSCPRTTGNSVEGSAITYFATPTLCYYDVIIIRLTTLATPTIFQSPNFLCCNLGEYVCIDSEL